MRRDPAALSGGRGGNRTVSAPRKPSGLFQSISGVHTGCLLPLLPTHGAHNKFGTSLSLPSASLSTFRWAPHHCIVLARAKCSPQLALVQRVRFVRAISHQAPSWLVRSTYLYGLLVTVRRSLLVVSTPSIPLRPCHREPSCAPSNRLLDSPFTGHRSVRPTVSLPALVGAKSIMYEPRCPWSSCTMIACCCSNCAPRHDLAGCAWGLRRGRRDTYRAEPNARGCACAGLYGRACARVRWLHVSTTAGDRVRVADELAPDVRSVSQMLSNTSSKILYRSNELLGTRARSKPTTTSTYTASARLACT